MPTLHRLAALLALLPAALSASTNRVPVIESPAPPFPSSLFTQAVNNGRALVVCTVNDDGSVLDLWTLETNHLAFAESAEGALRTWRYAPANVPAQSIVPWPRIDVVDFDFSRSGQITTKTHREAMAASFLTPQPASGRIEDIPAVSSERIARLEGKAPAAPSATPAGEVVVEFLLDRTGRVRLPVAIRADHLAHARAAVTAVSSWRFAALPPEIKTPAVRMRWNFRFPAQN